MTSPVGPSPRVELRHIGDDGPPTALVCLPFAGGGPSMFRSWPKLLPSADLYALGLPGREQRIAEPPFTALEPLVASAVDAIAPLAGRPFALFGHSMGALVAFETARRLRRENAATPFHLFVSSFRAPHLPDPRPPYYDLPRAEFIEELRRLNLDTFDPDKYPELVDLMLPTLRADFRTVQTFAYREEPPLTCPITAFGGSEDCDVDEWQLMEWKRHTSAAFAIRMLPGGHFFLHTETRNLLLEIARRLIPRRQNTQ
jgi:medium-chain acyl-[acyl-carrier-protein] hydrolase